MRPETGQGVGPNLYCHPGDACGHGCRASYARPLVSFKSVSDEYGEQRRGGIEDPGKRARDLALAPEDQRKG